MKTSSRTWREEADVLAKQRSGMPGASVRQEDVEDEASILTQLVVKKE
jgi:hypothetical protein